MASLPFEQSVPISHTSSRQAQRRPGHRRRAAGAAQQITKRTEQPSPANTQTARSAPHGQQTFIRCSAGTSAQEHAFEGQLRAQLPFVPCSDKAYELTVTGAWTCTDKALKISSGQNRYFTQATVVQSASQSPETAHCTLPALCGRITKCCLVFLQCFSLMENELSLPVIENVHLVPTLLRAGQWHEVMGREVLEGGGGRGGGGEGV